LLELHKPELIKHAANTFKSGLPLSPPFNLLTKSWAEILIYQGVRESEGQDVLTAAQEVVALGVREGQMRDEILCQLCTVALLCQLKLTSPSKVNKHRMPHKSK
jgi:hypothetical protein